jgi:hypothetical protein
VQSFEREGSADAVTNEPLDAGAILSPDAHGGVDAEAARVRFLA